MNPSKKFKRSVNFSQKENNVLLILVRKYREEIECKRTDTNTNKVKASAWLKLTKEFNMISGEEYRDVKALRNKYENIKKRTKEKYAEQKSYITGTGGGAAKDITITETDNEILELLGTQLTGHESKFDDDTVSESIVVAYERESEQESNHSTEDCYEGLMNEESLQSEPTTSNWLSCDTAILLKGRKSTELITKNQVYTSTTPKVKPGLGDTPKTSLSENKMPPTSNKRTPRKESLGYKLEEWAATKVQLADIQKRCFIEEHTLKMKLMQEKHMKEIEIMEKDTEERRELLRQEHYQRMQNFKNQNK